MIRTLVAIIALTLVGSPAISAQTTFDREWRWFGDLRVRGDVVDRPNDDIERARVSLRGGILAGGSRWEFGVAARANAASEDVFVVNDNEERQGLRLDQAFVRWFAAPSQEFTLGKSELPLWLTPLVWDEDLRPIGVSFAGNRSLQGFDAIRIAAGVFAPDHRFDDDSTLTAFQVFYLLRDGARSGGSLGLAWLDFEDTESLAAVGLGRTNSQAASRLSNGFELVDIQLGGRVPVWGGSLSTRFNTVRNLDADDDDEATRVELEWGQEVDSPGRWQAGAAFERVQSDAVVAAFNSDDWWFHSRFRGLVAWAGKSFGDRRSLRLAVFSERGDDQTKRFKRLILDFLTEW